MSLKRLFSVTRKTLLETVRDPILLVLVLGLPGFFMLINYFGYGHTPKTATYPLLLLSETEKAQPALDVLRSAVYQDGRPMFSLTPAADRDRAEVTLEDGSAAVLLILEEQENGTLFITTRGDALKMNFIKASAQVEALLIPWIEKEQGKPQTYQMVVTALDRPRPISEFETYVPGMMVFAILLLIPQTAMLIGRERRWGTWQRLELSRLHAAEYLGGLCLAQLMVAALQIVVMFATALALGFQNRGSLFLAVLVGMVLAFSSIGVGLLLGAFMRTDTDALNTGSAVSMLQVFLSGAFFAMPAPIVLSLFGHPMGVYDFLPATHAMLALQQILSGGAAFKMILFRFNAALFLSLVFFSMGVFVFQRKKG